MRKFALSLAVALLSVVSVVATTGASQAEDRRVKIINETNHTLREFHASNAGSNSWEEDILGDKEVPSGGSFVVNLDDGSGYCKFDFKGTFSDGESVEQHGVDVCNISVFRFTGD